MSFFYITEDVTPESDVSDEDVAVLEAVGEIDYAAAPQLRERILDQVKAGRRRVLLDLSTVTFIDSTAIGVVVGAVTGLQTSGEASLAIVCVEHNHRVRRILDIAGVNSLVTVHPSREQAFSELALAC
jgi:anti-anti-sigma factor